MWIDYETSIPPLTSFTTYRLSMESLPPVGRRMYGNRRSDKKRIRALGFADVERHQSAYNRHASKNSLVNSPSPVKKIVEEACSEQACLLRG